MTRQELIDFIFDEYSVEPDCPFSRDDVSCVFRHIDNRKWFGLIRLSRTEPSGSAKPGRLIS